MHPLPLIDGAFFIDNSTLELLATCPRALEYHTLHRRILAASKPSLNFGSAEHLALDYRYRVCRNAAPDALEESEQAAILAKYFSENVPPEDTHLNLNWAIEVMKKYNETYQVEPFNLLVADNDMLNAQGEVMFKKGDPLVEMPFALHLFDATVNPGIYIDNGAGDPVKVHSIPVFYSGRIDLPVMWNNFLTIIDHKTTGRDLTDWYFKEQRVSPQFPGYCWSFEQLTGQKVQAFCINAIRSRLPPQKPKAGMDAWWRSGFFRHTEFIFPWHLEEWKRNTIALIEEFFWYFQRGYFPQKKKWCSGKYGLCSYYDVCDVRSEERSLMLESTLFTDNDWSPLRQPTQPLQ